MQKLKIYSLIASTLLTTACATQTGWRPTVDAYNAPNAHRLEQDFAECERLAKQASGGTALETVKGAAVGGLLGAAGGAAIGALTGSPGTGAAIGAAAGGIGGGAKQGISAEGGFKNAFNNCMVGRGHKVLR